jgi:hypothetical protein
LGPSTGRSAILAHGGAVASMCLLTKRCRLEDYCTSSQIEGDPRPRNGDWLSVADISMTDYLLAKVANICSNCPKVTSRPGFEEVSKSLPPGENCRFPRVYCPSSVLPLMTSVNAYCWLSESEEDRDSITASCFLVDQRNQRIASGVQHRVAQRDFHTRLPDDRILRIALLTSPIFSISRVESAGVDAEGFLSSRPRQHS